MKKLLMVAVAVVAVAGLSGCGRSCNSCATKEKAPVVKTCQANNTCASVSSSTCNTCDR